MGLQSREHDWSFGMPNFRLQIPNAHFHKHWHDSASHKGFTLEELKAAQINKNQARSIGISVDFRRKNRSEESKRENVARLEQYKANLIVFPKKSNNKKGPTGIEASKAEQSAAEQYIGDVMPIIKARPSVTPYKITDEDKKKKVFYTLRVARTDAKMVGKREVRKKKAA